MKIRYKKTKEFAFACGKHFHLYGDPMCGVPRMTKNYEDFRIKYDVTVVDYCCDEMKRFYSHLSFWDGMFGYYYHAYSGDGPDEDPEEFKFKVCPFCGEKVETECVEDKEIHPVYEMRKRMKDFCTIEKKEVDELTIVRLREDVK